MANKTPPVMPIAKATLKDPPVNVTQGTANMPPHPDAVHDAFPPLGTGGSFAAGMTAPTQPKVTPAETRTTMAQTSAPMTKAKPQARQAMTKEERYGLPPSAKTLAQQKAKK